MKFLLAIFLAFLMLASPVYANGGGEGDNTHCQGQGNPNSPCDPDDDDDDSDSDDHDHNGSNGGTGGNGGSVDIGDVTVGGGEGGSVGDTSATGGSVGDTTAEGGDATGGAAEVAVVVEVEGDDIVYEAAEIPVNSAPPSFAAICSSGAAGSGSKLSLSFAVTSDVCTALMMADAYNAVGDIDEVTYWLKRAARHAKWKGNVGLFRTVITIGIL